METKKYLVPPKLQSKLLLSGLTVPELAIAFVVGLFGFFSSSKLNAVLWTGTWMLCVARLFFRKKSDWHYQTYAQLPFYFPATVYKEKTQ